MGLTIVFGRLLVGVLVDRFWAPAVASVFFVLPIIAMLLMLYGAPTIALGMVIGIAIGLAAGAELDMLAYLTGRYFGPAHYPAVFRWHICFFYHRCRYCPTAVWCWRASLAGLRASPERSDWSAAFVDRDVPDAWQIPKYTTTN